MISFYEGLIIKFLFIEFFSSRLYDNKCCFLSSFDVIYRVFCDCINIRFGRIFMRFVKRKLKNQNVSKYLVLVFFVRRKKRKKRHKFLTDVKNGLMLSKSLFEVVKEPK